MRLTVDTHGGHLCALMPVASQILLLAWFNSRYLGHLHRKCYYWRGSTARLLPVGIDLAHYFVISVHSTNNLLFHSAGASSPVLLHCHFLPLLPLSTSQSIQQSSYPLLDPSTIKPHSNKAALPSKYQPSCQEPLNSPVNEPFLFFLISFCKLHLDNSRCWTACVVWSFQRVCELSTSLPVNEPFAFFLISFCKLHLDNSRCWTACVVWSFQRVCELSSLLVNEPFVFFLISF
jgi:hypothetical protein